MILFARVALASAILAASGCGGTTQPASSAGERKDNAEQLALGQVSQMLEAMNGEGVTGGKAPAKLADLAKFQKAYPSGYGKIKTGEIVFFYGAPVQSGASDTVLAYDKSTPESGGFVLMQDGATIKKMTPEEFSSAKKAGTPPAATTAKKG